MPIELVIDEIYSFHSFEYIKQFPGYGESHDFWEFVYVDYGTITIVSDQEQYVLKEREAFLHAPNEYHNIFSSNSYANVIIFSFGADAPILEKLTKKVLTVNTYSRDYLKLVFQTGCSIFQKPWDLLEQSCVQFQEDIPVGMPQIFLRAVEMLMLSLIHGVEGNAAHDKAAAQVIEMDENLERVIQIMNRHLYEKISMDELCRECGFSKSYLARLFRRTLDAGVMEYYNLCKIREAKHLISEDNYSLEEISRMLKFQSTQYFSKVFRKTTGMTPSGYRKMISQKMTI